MVIAAPAPGAYLALRRAAAGRSIESVAADIATEPRWPQHVRAAWLRQIEAGEAPIALPTIAALRHLYPFDVDMLLTLADIQLGLPADAPQLCAGCGINRFDPYSGRTFDPRPWPAADRCAGCVPADGIAS